MHGVSERAIEQDSGTRRDRMAITSTRAQVKRVLKRNESSKQEKNFLSLAHLILSALHMLGLTCERETELSADRWPNRCDPSSRVMQGREEQKRTGRASARIAVARTETETSMTSV